MSLRCTPRLAFSLFAVAIVSSVSLAITGLTIDASEPDGVVESIGPEENVDALLIGRSTPRLTDLPGEAEEIVATYDQAAAAIRREAALAIRQRRLEAMRSLKALQDKHTRAAELDPAVAIRDTIRRMLETSFPAIDNPGSMQAYANKVGSSYLVRVTGRASGTVYGTGYYTYDSDIATACVHSGVLRDGETGLVVVSMISAGEPHVGSAHNGVHSYDWGIYPASFTLRRWNPSAEEIELGSLKGE